MQEGASGKRFAPNGEASYNDFRSNILGSYLKLQTVVSENQQELLIDRYQDYDRRFIEVTYFKQDLMSMC